MKLIASEMFEHRKLCNTNIATVRTETSLTPVDEKTINVICPMSKHSLYSIVRCSDKLSTVSRSSLTFWIQRATARPSTCRPPPLSTSATTTRRPLADRRAADESGPDEPDVETADHLV